MQEIEVHKVQILDPATGTGTFLAEVVKFIYSKRFKAMQGAWSGYVDEHLIPRLNGFELLMASYSMAHLKLDMLLRDTGYKATKNQRFNIYLTNSLEEHHPDTGTLFSNWLSTEANEANHIKRDTPVMCVIGNPPYAVSSTNKSEWILNILKDYKKDLNERKINLDDDYIKFIRYGQYYIDKNGEGILAYISNNSFIDGVTHRQMRKHLLSSFDKVYILDLHGSAMKNETTNAAQKDENVFDIMQGVSINIFVKTGSKKKNELGVINHYDLFGEREVKYPFLQKKNIKDIEWTKVLNKEPYYFFVPKDFELDDIYKKGFKIDDLLKNYVSGFQTKRDKITIKFSSSELKDVKDTFDEKSIEEIRSILQLPADGRDWKIEWAQKDLAINSPKAIKVMYRPFDDRYTYYTGNSKGFVAYPRAEMLQHLNKKDSLSLISCRQQSTFDFQHVFVSRLVSDMCNISSQTKETGYIFPLYIYPSQSNDEIFTNENRTPNLNHEIISKITDNLKLEFSNEKGETENSLAPIDILDYIYSVLHSPTYRAKYKEFLKIDFPRIPYPKNQETFWQLVNLGGEIRKIHLLETPKVEEYITSYPIDGDNTITTKIGKNDWEITDEENGFGRIWINSEQYFENIPLSAWEFYIGGYQPAQKWLKDRKERTLKFDDILHYQKIIVALSETDRLMKEIDKIEIE